MIPIKTPAQLEGTLAGPYLVRWAYQRFTSHISRVARDRGTYYAAHLNGPVKITNNFLQGHQPRTEPISLLQDGRTLTIEYEGIAENLTQSQAYNSPLISAGIYTFTPGTYFPDPIIQYESYGIGWLSKRDSSGEPIGEYWTPQITLSNGQSDLTGARAHYDRVFRGHNSIIAGLLDLKYGESGTSIRCNTENECTRTSVSGNNLLRVSKSTSRESPLASFRIEFEFSISTGERSTRFAFDRIELLPGDEIHIGNRGEAKTYQIRYESIGGKVFTSHPTDITFIPFLSVFSETRRGIQGALVLPSRLAVPSITCLISNLDLVKGEKYQALLIRSNRETAGSYGFTLRTD